MRLIDQTGLLLLTCLLAACGAGVGGDPPIVDGPLPRLDPAPPAPAAGAVAHLPKAWRLYSQPPERFGVPVLMAAGGTSWAVTGSWKPPAAIPGRQGWILDRAWYRLVGNVAPWGRVYLWGQLPDAWVLGGPVGLVEPAAGTPWIRVPMSVGHVVEPIGDRELQLRACPETDCPVLARPQDGHLVPVTGRLTDAAGRAWHRVEFRQMILWVPADAGRVRISVADRLRRRAVDAAGFRSCEPVVLVPPPPQALCPVDADGRFLNDLERQYDRLDPVLGRLPPAGTWRGHATPGGSGPVVQ